MAYVDIDSNKVLNKEGLLELSAQIKGYINANAPSPYTLPAASTITLGGVKVDGSTITIDNNGVISAAGGGSSYTAGEGINIDANNVISKNIGATPLFVLLSYILTGTQTGQYNQTATNTLMTNNMLGKANTNTHIANLKAYGMTITSDGTSQALMRAIVPAMGDVVANTFYYCNVGTNADTQYTLGAGTSQANTADGYMDFGLETNPTLILFNPNEAYGSYYRWYIIKMPWKLFQNHYFNSQQGLTSHSIAAAIDEVVQQIGNASGGGGVAYTAGANISIDANNVISATVPSDLSVNTIQTGTGANNYFQCQKFRGEGNANTYYHAIDFGYSGHNQVDFHEYGGTYTFYQNTGGSQSNGTELLKITPSDITYKGQSLLSGGSTYTLPTASTSVLGGVKIDGSTITIDANGVISAVGGNSGGGSALPAASTTDGIYFLKCVVSNSTPTYSWESVSIGGSY